MTTIGERDRDTVTSSPPALLVVVVVMLLRPLLLLLLFLVELVRVSRLAPSGRAAILASSSCSCCSAFTKAAFSRLVCSALSAFLTLLVTHCSQITRSSLPG